MALTNVFCAHGTLEPVVFFAGAGVALLGVVGTVAGVEEGESGLSEGLAAPIVALETPRIVALLTETLALEAAE